jgi:hypothetical protein
MKQANAVPDRAATLVVHPTPGIGDATTIADALAMLPAGGGSLLVREGTYSISATLTMPDKPVMIKGCGDDTIISLGANAIPAFTIPDGLSVRRDYIFENMLVTAPRSPPRRSGASRTPTASAWSGQPHQFTASAPIHITDGFGRRSRPSA